MASFRQIVSCICLTVLASLVASCGNITDPRSEFLSAQRATERWLVRHPSEWVLDLAQNQALTRPEWSKPCPQNPPSGFVTLRYAARSTEIDLFFRCPLAANARAEDLSAAFSHAALQYLPHRIASRGWSFRVVTPSSSIEKTVTFRRSEAGQLQILIDTPLFAVFGHSVRPVCQPPADGPSPEGCYLQREHRIPLRLGLAVPFDLSALR
jgi:hypothetical protein